MTTAAVLYIFSGVHLGARIELQEGSWELGSDDACDLILLGLAPHHALITVASADTQEDGTSAIQLSVRALDGKVYYNGEEISAETSLPAGSSWYLGETYLAWNYPNVEQKMLEPTSFAAGKKDPAENTETSKTEKSESTESTDGEKSKENNADQQTQVEVTTDEAKPAETEQPLEMASPEKKGFFASLVSKCMRPFPLIFLALLLSAVSFVLTTAPGSSEYPKIVLDLLEKEQLKGLSAFTRWPGVEVRGTVAKPSDLERLQNVVQTLSFPVYLEVKVDDDMIRAVVDCLGVQGFFPLVHIERTNGVVRIVTKAYMRDSLVEADAFAKLERDYPSPPDKKRHILHQEDISQKVTEMLSVSGLSDLSPVYLPGRVMLVGRVPNERVAVLARVQNQLSRHFGVPLFGEGNFKQFSKTGDITTASVQKLSIQEQLSSDSDAQKKGSEAKENQNPLEGVSITAVYRAPLSFVVLEDGRRFFVGAILPSGYVIEDISTSALHLRRGNSVVTYRLRGNNE